MKEQAPTIDLSQFESASTGKVEAAESAENKLNLLTSMRHRIAEELKLTFSLPNPREHGILDTTKNFAMKASGLAGVYVGRFMLEAGEHGDILRMPGDTEQTMHHMREAVEGVGIGTMALGAMSIWLANRLRSRNS